MRKMFFRPLLLWADDVRQHARRHALDPAHALGKDAEDLAHRHLQRQGLIVIARNWRTKSGWAEVDLIAVDERAGCLVFVEVKSRANDEQGSPERQISAEKRRKISAASHEFQRNSQYAEMPVRFDVVSVVFEPVRKVTHSVDAWSPTEALAAAQ